MSIRFAMFLLLVANCTACRTTDSLPEPSEAAPASTAFALPPIVAKSLAVHGGDIYERSAIRMTISSLSGSFEIKVARQGGNFEYLVTSNIGSDQVERRVRLTNDAVQEWREGIENKLDQEGQRRARAFVNARVFFPLLPYTLKSKNAHFEDLGLEHWEDYDLHKVKVTFTEGTSNDADDSYMFWFEPDTGRVKQFGYDFNGGLRYRKAIEFNRVGGILFSTQENYAIDGGRVSVDKLSPKYVSENMQLLSIVSITNIRVEPL